MSSFVAFCGVGGTGKTATMEALQKMRPDIVVLPSIVREYYARHGVNGEIDYQSRTDPEWRFQFQFGLLHEFTSTLKDRLLTANGSPVVMDRTVFDHLAYTIMALPGMTGQQLMQLLNEASEYMGLGPAVCYFPYPTPWTWGDQISDGFRATDIGKNYMLNAMMKHLLYQFCPKYVHMPEVSVDSRAAMIAHMIG